MLSVIMQSFIMLNVIMQSFIILIFTMLILIMLPVILLTVIKLSNVTPLLSARACIIKLITAATYGFRNKLECLSWQAFPA